MHPDDPLDLPSPRAPRPWPPANPPAAGEGIEATCEACGQDWEVHPSMAGFRLRCVCGEWVDVPAPLVEAEANESALAPRAAEVRLPERYRDPAEPLRQEVPTQTAMPAGSLRHATRQTRQRWIDRAVLEIFLVMMAFWGPYVFLIFTTEGRQQGLALPIASLASAVLVVAICLSMKRYSLAGLQPSGGRYYLEAIGVTLATLALAIPWSNFVMRSLGFDEDPLDSVLGELGLAWALLIIAVFPGIFEELAFRGLLQPRLMALLGRTEGILATATAFSLAHGISVGLPFHFFLGVYLGYLRERSGSLWPCMLMHFLYNGSLVLYAFA